MSVKITLLKLLPYLPGANEFIYLLQLYADEKNKNLILQKHYHEELSRKNNALMEKDQLISTLRKQLNQHDVQDHQAQDTKVASSDVESDLNNMCKRHSIVSS